MILKPKCKGRKGSYIPATPTGEDTARSFVIHGRYQSWRESTPLYVSKHLPGWTDTGRSATWTRPGNLRRRRNFFLNNILQVLLVLPLPHRHEKHVQGVQDAVGPGPQEQGEAGPYQHHSCHLLEAWGRDWGKLHIINIPWSSYCILLHAPNFILNYRRKFRRTRRRSRRRSRMMSRRRSQRRRTIEWWWGSLCAPTVEKSTNS